MLFELIKDYITDLMLDIRKHFGARHTIEIWAYSTDAMNEKSVNPTDEGDTATSAKLWMMCSLLQLDPHIFYKDVWKPVGYVGCHSDCAYTMYKAATNGTILLPQSIIDNCLIDGTCTWYHDVTFDVPTYVHLYLFDKQEDAEADFKSTQQERRKNEY